MSLDLSSLEKAIDALRLSVTESVPRLPELPEPIRETLKAGVIQQFEVAYEQGWKLMRRWIAENVGAETVDGVPRRELFRRAAESGLIRDVDRWMDFHRARNETSHTYSSTTANEVFTLAVHFLPAAESLLSALRIRNN
ncbi:MAG: nucleotidyltransferase substrate binding protein [Opitutaceae bacterium]|jgi:nucleotidyltransferase substrate binding protein (TIGR01987 family)|nr:nucleotidyltransferase substrate binding protein [Opitutaceae bacterium]